MCSFITNPDEIRTAEEARCALEEYDLSGMPLIDLEPLCHSAYRLTGDPVFMEFGKATFAFCTMWREVGDALFRTVAENPGWFLNLADLWDYEDIQKAFEVLTAAPEDLRRPRGEKEDALTITGGTTMSNITRTIELYEDNAGGLHLFSLDETDRGQRPAWGAYYYGQETNAAIDYGNLLNGCNPVADGWEFGSLENMAEVRRDYDGCSCPECELIASSDDVDEANPFGVDPNRLGASGKLFARALGVNLED